MGGLGEISQTGTSEGGIIQYKEHEERGVLGCGIDGCCGWCRILRVELATDGTRLRRKVRATEVSLRGSG